MNLVFHNPALLPLLSLVAVPLLLHLFARVRPPVYRFSSAEFLRRVLRNTRRVKRPQDWLLLLLRTALMAALVLTFLQPVLFLAGGATGRGTQRHVVVVVDATASMAWVEGAQTRFASACAEAAEVLAGLRSSDLADVVWLDAVPDAVFPALGRNLGFLQQALRRRRVGSEPGDIVAAVRLARDLLAAHPEGRPSLVLISDFQASAWQGVVLDLPADLPVVRIPIGDPARPAANVAIARLACDPPVPLTGEEAVIACEVRNFGPDPRRCTVYLTAGEVRQTREVLVPAWGAGEAVFAWRVPEPGTQGLSAALDEDTFPGDDRRWTVVEARASLGVGLAGSDAGLASRWRQALAALEWVHVSPLADADLAADLDQDVLLLAGWPGTAAARLREFVHQGGHVVLAPAPGLRLADLALLTGATAGTADSATAVLERLPAPRRLRLRAADDPLFRLFASGEYGDPVGGSFRARWSWPGASLPAGGSVLIEFEDGVPGLVRYRGSGTVFVWALPLTPECSDFAARVEFVPLLAELLLGCRDAGAGDRPGTAAYCGEPLAFDLPEGVTAVDIGLSDAAGTVLPTRLQDGPGVTRVVATEALSPGLYTWQRAETALARAAVNFPPVESDLRLQSAVALAGDGTTMLRAGADLRRLRDGVPLWPWLLAATLALALLEGVALQWVERTP